MIPDTHLARAARRAQRGMIFDRWLIRATVACAAIGWAVVLWGMLG